MYASGTRPKSESKFQSNGDCEGKTRPFFEARDSRSFNGLAKKVKTENYGVVFCLRGVHIYLPARPTARSI